MKAMSDLMKLAHVRQRFASDDPPKPVRQNVLEELVCTANANGTIGALLRMYEWHTGRDLKDQYRARVEAMVKAGVGHDPLVMRPLWHNGQDGDDQDHAASDEGPE